VKRFATRPDQVGYAVYDTSTGLLAVIGATPQDGLTLEEAVWTATTLNDAHGAPAFSREMWEALLADWAIRCNAIAAFDLFDEDASLPANLAQLDRLCELERDARDQVATFLRSWRETPPQGRASSAA
jgi:hypothetical protein